jgi:hypothetical protein
MTNGTSLFGQRLAGLISPFLFCSSVSMMSPSNLPLRSHALCLSLTSATKLTVTDCVYRPDVAVVKILLLSCGTAFYLHIGFCGMEFGVEFYRITWRNFSSIYRTVCSRQFCSVTMKSLRDAVYRNDQQLTVFCLPLHYAHVHCPKMCSRCWPNTRCHMCITHKTPLTLLHASFSRFLPTAHCEM